jgi:hypothetical protein
VLICLAAFLPKAEFVQRSVVGGYLKPVTQWLASTCPSACAASTPRPGRRLDDEKKQYMQDFLGGSGKKDDRDGKDKESSSDRMEKLSRTSNSSGKIQDLLDQNKK